MGVAARGRSTVRRRPVTRAHVSASHFAARTGSTSLCGDAERGEDIEVQVGQPVHAPDRPGDPVPLAPPRPPVPGVDGEGRGRPRRRPRRASRRPPTIRGAGRPGAAGRTRRRRRRRCPGARRRGRLRRRGRSRRRHGRGGARRAGVSADTSGTGGEGPGELAELGGEEVGVLRRVRATSNSERRRTALGPISVRVALGPPLHPVQAAARLARRLGRLRRGRRSGGRGGVSVTSGPRLPTGR